MTLDTDFLNVKKYICEILDEVSLAEDTVEAVNHYLSHSEYEMAFEGLFIDLMEKKIVLTEPQKQQALTFAKQLRLDIETVFSSTFWNDLLNYTSIS